MPSDDDKSISKGLTSQRKGYASDAISMAVARDVLRRVQNGELPASNQENEKSQYR